MNHRPYASYDQQANLHMVLSTSNLNLQTTKMYRRQWSSHCNHQPVPWSLAWPIRSATCRLPAPSFFTQQVVHSQKLLGFALKVKAELFGRCPVTHHTKCTRLLKAAVVVLTLAVLVVGGDGAVEAILAPFSAPTVSDNPVLRSVVCHAPAHNADSMVVPHLLQVLSVDTAGVLLFQKFRGKNAACHRASVVHLGFYFVVGVEVSKLGNSEALVVLNVEAIVRPAGETLVLSHTLLVECPVVVAAFLRDALLVSVPQRANFVASIAVASLAARYDILHRQQRCGPCPSSSDVVTVGQGRGGRKCPAGAAVDGDVLVASVRQVVFPVHISPVPLCRQLVREKDLMWALC